MSDLKARIGELAGLMDEFGLDKGKLQGEGWCVEFSRTTGSPAAAAPTSTSPNAKARTGRRDAKSKEGTVPVQTGTPVTSPMTGIFYASPSPGSAAFVKVGDLVIAGQVVGLIEAMKVFSDITSPVSGTVTQCIAKDGAMVNPGEPLIYVG